MQDDLGQEDILCNLPPYVMHVSIERTCERKTVSFF
jgi:hypothetical protein